MAGSPRILIVRFSAVGDCTMAAWAVTALRNALPSARIDWAVESRCAEVVDTSRLVTNRQDFPRDRWKRSRWSVSTWRDQLAHYSRLRGQGYEIGFDLQGHSKTALCLYLAKPARRVAAFATDGLARRLNPVFGNRPEGVHLVEWFGQVVESLVPCVLPARPFMPEVAGGESGTVVIGVGAGQRGNVVPPELWTEVGRRLADSGHRVRYIGGPEVQFDPPPGTVSLVGKTSLTELMATIAASRVVIAGDTGAGHLAAAYGVPTVSLFGWNDPRTYRPYHDRGVVLKNGQTTANHTADDVLGAMEKVL